MSVTNIPKSTWDALNNKCKLEGGKLFSSADICKPGETLPIPSARISGDAWLAVSDSSNEWIQLGVEKTPHPPCLSHTKNYGPPEWGMSGTFDATYYACNIPVKAAPNIPSPGTPAPPTTPSPEELQKIEKARIDREKAEKEAAEKAKADQEAEKNLESTRGWGLTIGILLLSMVICCIILMLIAYFSSGPISAWIFGSVVKKGVEITRKGLNDAARLINKSLESLKK